jgi:hypothetical protein
MIQKDKVKIEKDNKQHGAIIHAALCIEQL